MNPFIQALSEVPLNELLGTTIVLTICLVILFHIKHFIADYPLQNAYMLGKFKEKDWVLPLAAHCSVHFIFTFLIVLLFRDLKLALVLGCFDFAVHFIMDRIKASPKLLGRFEALSKKEATYLMNPGEIIGDYMKKSHETRKTAAFKSNTYFWWALGLDQMVHHITDLLIVVGMLLL